MQIDWLDILLFVLFFQLLTIVPYLLVQKGKRSTSNKLLAAFLLAKAICISNMLGFRMYDTFHTHFPHIFLIGTSFTILWGPLLYLYTRSITNPEIALRKRDILHISPAILHLSIMSVHFHFHSTATKQMLLDSGQASIAVVDQFYTLYLIVSIWIYIVLSYRLLFLYRRKLLHVFSSLQKINLNWLAFVLTGFMLKWAGDVWVILAERQTMQLATLPLYISRITLFIFINVLIFKGLKNPVIFTGSFWQEGFERKSLSDSASHEYQQKLLTFMQTEQPYLNPDLSLVQLSKQVKIPQRSLSEILNNHLHKNFYDFINDYRIQAAQKHLVDPTHQSKTILEILYTVGFNSKSSFNKAFKKVTGTTPLDYRRSQNQAA